MSVNTDLFCLNYEIYKKGLSVKHYFVFMLIFVWALSSLTAKTALANEEPLTVKWSTIKKLDKGKHPNADRVLGKTIKIKGFMIPIDFESKRVTSFLFAPYFPACMHVPPPPPESLMLAKIKTGVEITDPWLMTEIIGVLTVDKSNAKDYSYVIEVQKLSTQEE